MGQVQRKWEDHPRQWDQHMRGTDHRVGRAPLRRKENQRQWGVHVRIQESDRITLSPPVPLVSCATPTGQLTNSLSTGMKMRIIPVLPAGAIVKTKLEDARKMLRMLGACRR